jgi:hypothetical protein
MFYVEPEELDEREMSANYKVFGRNDEAGARRFPEQRSPSL